MERGATGKHKFEQLQARVERFGFQQRKAAWQKRGLHVCRHGVFFRLPRGSACDCMAAAFAGQCWRKAASMPMIDCEAKALVVTGFEALSFQRLGVLQAELRRLGF